MLKLGIALLVVIEFGIVGVAYVNYPEEVAPLLFWGMVFWLMVLVFLNWFASVYTIFFGTQKPTSRIFGVLPSLNIAVFLYSLISASLLPFWEILFIGAGDNIDLNSVDLNLTLQITSLVGCIVIVLALLMTGKAAETSIPSGLISHRELAAMIEGELGSVPEDKRELRTEITRLLDVLRYSLPHPSALKETAPYEKLTNDIQGLDLSALSDKEAKTAIQEMFATISKCQHRRT